MNKTLALAAAAAATALATGCATGPQQSAPAAWGYQPGQRAPSIISDVEFETLSTQVSDLKTKRQEIRDGMRTVGDPAVRAQRQRIIDELTERMQPLEYRLRAAGRPVPPG